MFDDQNEKERAIDQLTAELTEFALEMEVQGKARCVMRNGKTYWIFDDSALELEGLRNAE